MNREDIIRTAQEAGMVHDEDDDSFFSPSNLGMDVHINNLKRFAAIVAALEAKDEPVQVSPLQFVEMVIDKEDCIGKPIIWAEWPNKENK